MSRLTSEKLAQATQLLQNSDIDMWITFVRETADGGDPALPLILDGGLTWVSALIVHQSGRKIAIVGNYDADPLVASGDWDEVVPYVQGIKEPLLARLKELNPVKVGLNFSVNDCKSDGLSHGMYLLFQDIVKGTEFDSRLVSAEQIVGTLRSVKTPSELARIQEAIRETDVMFDDIAEFAEVGVSEQAVYNHVHQLARERNLGFSWDPVGDPIVNSGPDSMIGHGIPSDSITIQPGHIFHIDLGLTKLDYSSDIQRCWYVPHAGENAMPDDVAKALEAVNAAISAAAAALKPGVAGWEVDDAARQELVSRGYPEYMHAVGHQVGRVAHDGGGILGPRWERYGNTPYQPVLVGQVYTLELGITVPSRGYLGLEEMVVVENNGPRWLSNRQTSIQLLG